MDKQTWGSKLKELRSIIRKELFIDEAKTLALQLHEIVYTSEMSGTNQRTFEDELWEDLSEETARKAVNAKGRTVVYGIWHATRIEDITMNLLVAADDQIFEKRESGCPNKRIGEAYRQLSIKRDTSFLGTY